MAAAPDASADARLGWRDMSTLALLVVMYVLLMADSRLMSAIVPELAAEYGVGNKTLGLVGTAFVLSGAVMAVVFGALCDRVARKKLLVVTVLVGEIPCLLTGFHWFTESFMAFAALRLLTGIGMGGIGPIAYSLVADYFGQRHRAKASAGITVAWAVGILLGPSLAGYLTDSYGWRIGFILAAAPSFPLALLFAWVAREPERGARDTVAKAQLRPSYVGGSWHVLRNRTNLAIYLQGLFGTIPWGVTGFWAISYFEQVGGVSKAMATSLQNLVGVGAIAGAIAFGVIGDRLQARRPAYVPIMCGVGVLVGILPFSLLFNLSLDDTEITWMFLIAVAAGFTAACASSNVKAILMNENDPHQRGRVFGLLSLIEGVGPGFGPVLGAMFFEWWGMAAGMNFAIAWWVPCGLSLFMCSRTLSRDRHRANAPVPCHASALME